MSDDAKEAGDDADKVDLPRVFSAVVDMIVKHLNPTTIPHQLGENGARQQCKCVTALKYIEHTVESISDVYVLFVPQLALWVVVKLLAVLAESSCEPLHDQVLDILSSLLRLLAYRDSSTFHAIVADFATLLVELRVATTTIAKNRAENIFPVHVPMFVDSVNRITATSASFPSTSDLSCFHVVTEVDGFVGLQLAVARVFTSLVASSVPMRPSSFDRLWSILVTEFERETTMMTPLLVALLRLAETTMKRKRDVNDNAATRLALRLIDLCSCADDANEAILASCIRLAVGKIRCDSNKEILLKTLCRGGGGAATDCVRGKLRVLTETLIGCLSTLSSSLFSLESASGINVSACCATLFRFLDRTDFRVGISCLVKFLLCETSPFSSSSSSASSLSSSSGIFETPSAGAKRMKLHRKEGSASHAETDSDGTPRKRKRLAKRGWDCPILDQITETMTQLVTLVETLLKAGSVSVLKRTMIRLGGMIQIVAQCSTTLTGKGFHLALLSDSGVVAYCRTWTAVVEKAIIAFSLADLIALLEAIFDGLDALIFACETAKLQEPTLGALLRLASLPWLKNARNLPSGSVVVMEKDAELSERLIGVLEGEEKTSFIWAQSLHAIAALSSDYALQFRQSVLALGLESRHACVRRSAIGSLLLFAGYATSARESVLQSLLYCVEDDDFSVRRELAGRLGLVALTMSDGVQVKRKIPLNQDRIRLSDCANLERRKGALAKLNATLFQPFFELEKGDVDGGTVRRAFLQSLPLVIECLDLSRPTAGFLLDWCILSLGGASKPDELVLLGSVIESVLDGTKVETVVESIVHKLKSELSAASDDRTREGVLLTLLGRVGSKSSGACLVRCLTTLLDVALFHAVASVKAAAFSQVRVVVVEASGVDGTRFFVANQQALCEYICSVLHNIAADVAECRRALKEFAYLFQFDDDNQLVSSKQKYLLPRLVCDHFASAPVILRLFSDVLAIDRPQLVFNNSRYIFSYAIRMGDGSQVDKMLRFLESETNFDLDSILRAYAQHTYKELLLHISACPEKVFHGLVLMSRYDPQSPSIPLTSPADLPSFLQPHLLELLAFFNGLLLAGNTEAEQKSLVLRSLIYIMNLLGAEYLSPVRLKVIAILRLSMTLVDAVPVELCLESWLSFVRNIEPESLGNMLSEITISLLPLLDAHSDKVAKIFNYLFVEKRETLQSHFCDIFYIPPHPALADVLAVVREYQDSQEPTSNNFSTQIDQLLTGCRHERGDVRRYAAANLSDFLRNHRHALSDLIASSETLSPVVCDAVTTILRGVQDGDTETRLSFAECFGLIGAIDPGRLRKVARNRSLTAKGGGGLVHDGARSVGFCVKLIGELVRAFQAALDTRAQDCCAYTLQEVLKTYGCATNADETSLGGRVWRSFSKPTQILLEPYLRSHYKAEDGVFVRDVKTPIYGSQRCRNFDSWIVCWLCHLTSCLESAPDMRNLFESCSLTYTRTISIGLFLLPYLVTEVIFEDRREATAKIGDEMMAVVRHAQKNDNLSPSQADFRQRSAQTVLLLHDSLVQTCQHWKNRYNVAKDHVDRQILDGVDLTALKRRCSLLDDFLTSVPKEALAVAAFNCKSYSASLVLFESSIRQDASKLEEHIFLLRRVYAALDEPDGFVGLSAICSVPASLVDRALECEMKGNLDEAPVCYRAATQNDFNVSRNHEGLVQAWLRLGENDSALNHLDRLLAKRTQWTKDFNKFRVEACLQLGEWDSLQQYVALEPPHHSSDWSVGVGRLLLAIKSGANRDFVARLRTIRQGTAKRLAAALAASDSSSSSSYERGYDYVAQLHVLQDLEEAAERVFFVGNVDRKEETLESLRMQWNRRLELIQMSFRVREPILRLQRAVFHLVPAPMLERESWLTSARIARKAGYVGLASSCVLKSELLLQPLPEVWLEKAKCLWSQGKTKEALVFLQDNLKKECNIVEEEKEKRPSARAKAMLLVGRWMEATALCETNTIIGQYRDLMQQHANWESSHFYLAKYYDRIMAALEESKPGKEQECLPMIIQHYGNSLLYGNQYIYQSMPRLLTSWLDYGAKVYETNVAAKESGRRDSALSRHRHGGNSLLKSLNDIVKDLVKRLAPFQFFTAFSQIVSRITHPHRDVHAIVENLLAKLVTTYPQQAIWMMLAVYKSSHSGRHRRCDAVFDHAKKLNPSLRKLLKDFLDLTEKLIELSDKNYPKVQRQVTMDSEFRPLLRLVRDSHFSQIFVPDKAMMTVVLPTSVTRDHHPFPDDLPFISDFGPIVNVLSSLARPKKIVIRGSDGRDYPILCKPKDDLRKDSRLMEFNGLVNRCLYQDAESRRRSLHIQTYAVLPLSESCGLIGWLENTTAMRPALNKFYQEKGRYVSPVEVKRLWAPIESNPHSSMDVKRRIFRELLTKHQPPVLHEWFARTFAEPSSWYQSRLAFSRSLAVMSMVGAVLGLGDRHTENILLDSATGDVVHVDFDCLFDKGITFTFPEKVPFRLTHNLVDALGCTGVEGPFRLASEATMRVLREQKDSLVSVFSTMIHDPLVEWQKSRGDHRSKGGGGGGGGGGLNTAIEKLEKVEQNLQGLMPYNRGMPLSVEGHVHNLIQQATDEDNLAQMFVGWAPYM